MTLFLYFDSHNYLTHWIRKYTGRVFGYWVSSVYQNMSHVYRSSPSVDTCSPKSGELRMAVCPSTQRRKVKQVFPTNYNVRKYPLRVRQGVQRCIGEKKSKCWQLKKSPHTKLFSLVVCQLFCHPDFDPNKTGLCTVCSKLAFFQFSQYLVCRYISPSFLISSFSCWRSVCPQRGVDIKMLMYSDSSGSVHIWKAQLPRCFTHKSRLWCLAPTHPSLFFPTPFILNPCMIYRNHNGAV